LQAKREERHRWLPAVCAPCSNWAEARLAPASVLCRASSGTAIETKRLVRRAAENTSRRRVDPIRNGSDTIFVTRTPIVTPAIPLPRGFEASYLYLLAGLIRSIPYSYQMLWSCRSMLWTIRAWWVDIGTHVSVQRKRERSRERLSPLGRLFCIRPN